MTEWFKYINLRKARHVKIISICPCCFLTNQWTDVHKTLYKHNVTTNDPPSQLSTTNNSSLVTMANSVCYLYVVTSFWKHTRFSESTFQMWNNSMETCGMWHENKQYSYFHIYIYIYIYYCLCYGNGTNIVGYVWQI
jgi:hypothetical protein